ncbi:hypothetical protein DFH07DRAFT_750021 [Mycena maculata]|uniref:Uncharacterized protein n=1 Tax=Mycena maculata TaxID=230809 RepID=A0AAD7IHI9_9AGAR|nr:hypothetical protein DFH07DRAFT_750021 [Mycena maculata]
MSAIPFFLWRHFEARQLCALTQRVGVEGFFCIVRNSPDFTLAPQWFFTSEELKKYMPLATRKKWVTSEVGTKVEALAADYLKSCIRDMISEKLITITGDRNAQMQYVWYEQDIIQKYSIILVGWTFPELVNPSKLSTSLPALQELHDALKGGKCDFKRLSRDELEKRRATWEANVAAGRVEAKNRQGCSDKNVKRKRRADDDGEQGDSGENDNDNDGGNDKANGNDDRESNNEGPAP